MKQNFEAVFLLDNLSFKVGNYHELVFFRCSFLPRRRILMPFYCMWILASRQETTLKWFFSMPLPTQKQLYEAACRCSLLPQSNFLGYFFSWTIRVLLLRGSYPKKHTSKIQVGSYLEKTNHPSEKRPQKSTLRSEVASKNYLEVVSRMEKLPRSSTSFTLSANNEDIMQ